MEEKYIEIKESKEYLLSNYGNIKNKFTGELKSFTIIGKGYKAVSLHSKPYLIHRLVAKYFVKNDNPTIKNTVNHKDENKLNNKSDNLEWCTNKENLEYSDCFNRSSLLQSKYKVIQYDKNGNVIKIWNSKEQVSKEINEAIKSAISKNTFNRWFNDSFWFTEYENFDDTRYKPVKLYKVYNKYNNELILDNVTIYDIAKQLKITAPTIYGRIKRNRNKDIIINRYLIKNMV